jgi:uncharacterized protein (UPF0335 family)
VSGHADLSIVIDRTASIENLLNQVIEKFCRPRKEAFSFFLGVVLDSSIMPMGAKARVAMAISQEVGAGLDQKALHKVISLRNAFAHHSVNSHPTLFVAKAIEENKSCYTLRIIDSSGRVSRKLRQNAFDDFNSSYGSAKESLMGLIETIERQREADVT